MEGFAMSHEFNDSLKVHINRDVDGNPRDLLHIEEPYVSKAPTPQMAAREYLEKFGSLIGITAEELKHLSQSPETKPIEAPVEYRFLQEKMQFDTTTVVFTQTCLGIPVWGAGLAVHIRLNPLQVVSAQLTHHVSLEVRKPPEEAVRRLEKLHTRVLAKHLGLSKDQKEFNLASLRIEKLRLLIYRYEAAKRVLLPEKPPQEEKPALVHEYPTLPLPPTAKQIQDGQHYVAAEVIFVLETQNIPDLRWVAIIEAETLSILFLRPFIDTVGGLVFREDPVTTNGGPLPSAGNAALNPLRSAVVLQGLAPPAGGNYALVGAIVQLQDVEPPPVAPPTEPVGTDFDFDARTNNFAAVNAYYHSDRFFRLVQELGFDLNTYFGGTIFPTVVDHRGLGGNVVNAHCLGNGAFGILRSAYALADLSNIAQPLGLACDWRVVLHELGGHGTLYNHVNSANFGFSHSAGDSFGAVLNDPDSKAPDRFETFPWVYAYVLRRHDRTPAGGWGWNGQIALNPFNPILDGGGYNNEQILCTTHFRIYRSIGGDSPEIAMRRFAARYVAYLILRTIGALTVATNPPNATAYAAGLITAELGDWTSEAQVGGCYWKVIRWSFEKQGLYQPAAMPKPNNNIGDPPPVDVYIDDGRKGEYEYGPLGQYPFLQKFWETTEIWNRHEPDGKDKHQTPIVGMANYAYVRVKNRGTTSANNVKVSGWHCRPTAGMVWPDDLKPMTTDSLNLPSLPSGGHTVVGPFEWYPQVHGHECMFMSVSAPGDLANNDPTSFLPAAAGPTPLWRMVPCDNNLGLRGMIPVPGGGHRRALEQSFRNRHFWASNPFPYTAKVEIRPEMPPFLLTRGWAVNLDNPGGGSFSLGPRDSRIIRPRLISGQDFTAAQLIAAGQVTIVFPVLVDGLVVGGLTYVLDPDLKHPARESVDEPEEHEEHKEKRPRRIKLEVDID